MFSHLYMVCIIRPDAKVSLNFKTDISFITIYPLLSRYIIFMSLKIGQDWKRIMPIFENYSVSIFTSVTPLPLNSITN